MLFSWHSLSHAIYVYIYIYIYMQFGFLCPLLLVLYSTVLLNWHWGNDMIVPMGDRDWVGFSYVSNMNPPRLIICYVLWQATTNISAYDRWSWWQSAQKPKLFSFDVMSRETPTLHARCPFADNSYVIQLYLLPPFINAISKKRKRVRIALYQPISS